MNIIPPGKEGEPLKLPSQVVDELRSWSHSQLKPETLRILRMRKLNEINAYAIVICVREEEPQPKSLAPESLATQNEWIPHRERNEIADGFKMGFVNMCERVRMVQEHNTVSSFQFIKGGDLLKYRRFPHYKEVKHLLKRSDEIREGKHFISHRWFSPTHPDPDGKQLALLRPCLEADSFYWVDFSCIPQKPRTQQEESLFRDSISWLPSLMFNMNFIVLRFEDDGYVDRAWCFFELLAATVLSHQIRFVNDQSAAGEKEQIEINVLQSTLLEGRLPPDLGVTDNVDRDAIEKAAETVTTFFKLRLIDHYMILGQEISGQDFFFGEDPYYLMATCDFSRVMVWSLKKAQEHQMSLVELGHSGDGNFFVRLAEKEAFCHATNPYSFSRRITRDEARQQWLVINKHRPDSASNLFYILSSMIE